MLDIGITQGMQGFALHRVLTYCSMESPTWFIENTYVYVRLAFAARSAGEQVFPAT